MEVLFIRIKVKDIVEKGVKVGDKIKKGQVIGYMGNTGNVIPMPDNEYSTNGTHLHFVVYKYAQKF